MLRSKLLLQTLARPGLLGWLVAAFLCIAATVLPLFQGVELVQGGLGATSVFALTTARVWAPKHTLAESFLRFAVLLVVALLLVQTTDVIRTGVAPILLLVTDLAVSAWVTRRFAPDLGQTGVLWLLCAVAPQGVCAGIGMALAMLVVAAREFEIGSLSPLLFVAGAFLGHQLGAWASFGKDPWGSLCSARPRAAVSAPADWCKHDLPGSNDF